MTRDRTKRIQGEHSSRRRKRSAEVPVPPPGEVSEWLKEHAWKACVPKRYRGFESLPLRQSPRFVSYPAQGLVRVDPVVVAVGPPDLERVGADRPVGNELESPLGQRPVRAPVDVSEEVTLSPAHCAGALAAELLQRQVVLAAVVPDDHELLADVDDVPGNRAGHRPRLFQSETYWMTWEGSHPSANPTAEQPSRIRPALNS